MSNYINISNWDTSNVTSIASMFATVNTISVKASEFTTLKYNFITQNILEYKDEFSYIVCHYKNGNRNYYKYRDCKINSLTEEKVKLYLDNSLRSDISIIDILEIDDHSHKDIFNLMRCCERKEKIEDLK